MLWIEIGVYFTNRKEASMTGSPCKPRIICKPVPKHIMDAYLQQQAHCPTPSMSEKNCLRILRVMPSPTQTFSKPLPTTTPPSSDSSSEAS